MGNVFTQKMQMHKKKDKEIMYIKKKSILQVEVQVSIKLPCLTLKILIQICFTGALKLLNTRSRRFKDRKRLSVSLNMSWCESVN